LHVNGAAFSQIGLSNNNRSCYAMQASMQQDVKHTVRPIRNSS